MFKKLKKRFTKWKNWRAYTNLSLWSQLMVLFGVKHSASFDAFKSINDFENYKDFVVSYDPRF